MRGKNSGIWEMAKAHFRAGNPTFVTINGRSERMTEDLIRRIESGEYERGSYEGSTFDPPGDDDSAFARRKAWSDEAKATREAGEHSIIRAAADAFARQFASDASGSGMNSFEIFGYCEIGGVDLMPAISAAIQAANQARADAERRRAGNVETIDL